MTRPLIALAFLALPAVASAQVGTPASSGPVVLGGRLVSGPPIASGANALFPVETPAPPRFSVGGGSLSGYPQIWLPSGPWGGVNYPWPIDPTIVPSRARTGPIPARPTRTFAVSPQFASSGQSATLVVQFPATAEVWVNGKKRDADSAAEWTLTSPPLAAGESHTFEVKGRWTTGARTFEAQRVVVVTAGDRNRWIVVSGTEVKE